VIPAELRLAYFHLQRPLPGFHVLGTEKKEDLFPFGKVH